MDAESPLDDEFPQGKFRLALESDNKNRIDLVHEDLHRWSGVIYLSLPEDCQGGIGLYKHRKTGALASTKDWYVQNYPHLIELSKSNKSEFREELLRIFRDASEWVKIGEIPMLYNRAVLLMSQCFHGSTGIFGTSVANGRLTQNFQFFSKNDGL